jgi:hypothetical protein
MAPMVKYIEQDGVTLRVAPLNGDGVALRLLAADERTEHRLRLSEANARELLRLLRLMLEPSDPR